MQIQHQHSRRLAPAQPAAASTSHHHQPRQVTCTTYCHEEEQHTPLARVHHRRKKRRNIGKRKGEPHKLLLGEPNHKAQREAAQQNTTESISGERGVEAGVCHHRFAVGNRKKRHRLLGKSGVKDYQQDAKKHETGPEAILDKNNQHRSAQGKYRSGKVVYTTDNGRQREFEEGGHGETVHVRVRHQPRRVETSTKSSRSQSKFAGKDRGDADRESGTVRHRPSTEGSKWNTAATKWNTRKESTPSCEGINRYRRSRTAAVSTVENKHRDASCREKNGEATKDEGRPRRERREKNGVAAEGTKQEYQANTESRRAPSEGTRTLKKYQANTENRGALSEGRRVLDRERTPGARKKPEEEKQNPGPSPQGAKKSTWPPQSPPPAKAWEPKMVI